MNLLQYIKQPLENRHSLLILMFLVLSLSAKATNTGTSIPTSQETPLIQNINYEYQLISKSQDELDCVGTLSFSISLPPNATILLFERTTPHVTDPGNLRFLLKSEYPIATTSITIPDVYWGTYFRIGTTLTNGNKEYSPIYSINDYISSSDLERLMNQSSVETIDTDSIRLYTKNKNLYIETTEIIFISIFDLSGKPIYSEDISQPTVLPLYNIDSPCVIATYKSLNTVITKKVLLQ